MRDNSAAGTIVINKTKYFACAEPLTLYNRNAPFSDEHWLLLGMVPNSTLMIGDIIASGETLVQCLRYVTDYYRKQGAKLRNILLFTIGGTQGIEILEKLTKEIRTYWPDFEASSPCTTRAFSAATRKAIRAFPASTVRSSTFTGRRHRGAGVPPSDAFHAESAV